MSKKRKQKADSPALIRDRQTDKLIVILVFLTIGLAPLIVRLKTELFVSPLIDPMIVLSTRNTYYLFTYYKFFLLAVFSLMILAVFCYQLFFASKHIANSIINILLGSFAVSATLATVLSDYKTIALFGMSGRNMGFISFLCFALLTFVIVNSPGLRRYVKYAFYVLIPFLCVNAFFVALNYLGYNVLSNRLVSWLIAGNQGLSKGSFIMGTLAHFNYTSGLGAILFAFFAAALVFKCRKRNEKIIFLIMTILASVIVFGSRSLSGVVTYIFTLILLIAFVVGSRDKIKLLRLGEIIFSAGIVYVLMTLYDQSFFKELLDDVAILGATAIAALLLIAVYVTVRYLWQQSARNRLIFGCAIIAVLLLAGVILGPKASDKISQELSRTSPDVIQQKLEKDEFDLPQPGWAMGTGRLYLWQETLKLSLRQPLFGYGLDTLPFVFNQGDPAKIAGVNDARVTVDKPHNIYVNMLYGAGVLALLSYLAMVGIVLFRSFRTIYEKRDNALLLLPFVMGILAYLYQGLFNDPVQGMEQVSWVFLGFSYLLTIDNSKQESNSGQGKLTL